MKKDELKNSEITDEQTSQMKVISGKTEGVASIGITRFRVDLSKGLNDEQVASRVEQGLVNKVQKGSNKTIVGIVFKNIFTVFNLIALSVAFWLISVGSYKDLLFMIIVSANVAIGIVQEIRAKLMIDKLSLLSAPTSIVLRNGVEVEIPVDQIVLDDIVILSAGKQISSDAIVKEGLVEVNESLLTGESDALIKKPGSSLFSGSFVVSGTCKAKVERVSKENYIEKLTSQAKIYKMPKSNLLKSLQIIIRIVLVFILPVTFLMFNIQYQTAKEAMLTDPSIINAYKEAVIRTSSSIIGLVPSGLFLTTSITLAVGIIKLSQKNTLVQELYSIEMLARIDVLCLDKTGTITDGTMSVKGIEEIENKTELSIKQIISMMQSSLNDKNMTSVALEKEFGKAKKVKSIFILAFSSSRKYSAVSYEKHGTFFLGAPEFILKKEFDKISSIVEKQAKKGYRVLLVAHLPNVIKSEQEIEGLKPSPIALILIEDTIRGDAIETIQYFKSSGVEVKVISGDNPLTVSMVAKRAGIENSDKYISMDRVSDDSISEIATKYTVFGRVSPNQKKLLVEALKAKNKTVAMTGDGVNDILALKEADCSIALASGSEAARNVSHLVLLDSNFSSMPQVVQEGRRVINNIERVATLFLTKTIFTFILSFIIIYANYIMGIKLSYPIELKQLNIIEFLGIGIPAFVLALEANNSQIKGKFIFNVLKNALPGAIVIIVNFLTIFFLQESLYIDADKLSTMSLVVTAYAFLMVLQRACKPFNTLRRILYFSMLAGFVASFTFNPIVDFLELVPLEVPQLLLVLLLVVLTNWQLDFLIKLPGSISLFISEKIRFKKLKIILVEKEKKRKVV